MTVADALPNRPVSRNELYDLESHQGIRITMPQSAPFDDDARDIRCVMIVGETQTVAVGFDEGAGSWEELRRESTPDGAFTGEFITNEDHDHPEIQRIMDAMEEWDESS